MRTGRNGEHVGTAATLTVRRQGFEAWRRVLLPFRARSGVGETQQPKNIRRVSTACREGYSTLAAVCSPFKF